MPSSIIGPVVGSLIGGSASKKAAKQQAAAADDANAQQMEMYKQSRADQLPFLNSGVGANRQLAYLLGLNPADIEKEQGNSGTAQADPYADVNKGLGGYGSLSKSFGAGDFSADPGYAFRMAEGQKALERSQSAKGGLLSGAAVKAATRFNQDTASDEYGNAYNRFNTNQTNLYNRLAGVAGSAQTSANQLGTLGQNTANQIGDNITSAGAANAAGTIGQANSWATGLNNIANSFGGSSGSGTYNPGTFNLEAYTNGLPWSDIRLKRDIYLVGFEQGLPVYHFSYRFPYLGNPIDTVYRGVMAQDVLRVYPEAVVSDGEYMAVDYSKLGIEFGRVAAWH